MEETLVPKEGQRVEGGEEARVMMRVHEQGWNCWRNTEEARVMTCMSGRDPRDGGKTGSVQRELQA
jgi:hypothetical protein